MQTLHASHVPELPKADDVEDHPYSQVVLQLNPIDMSS